MGTTRIKVIDLSSGQEQIKTSRKHAEKLAGAAKIKASSPEGVLARREEKKAKKESTSGTTPGPSNPLAPSVADVKAEFIKPPAQLKKTTDKKLTLRQHHLGQKYLRAAQLIEKNKLYPAKEAFELLSKTSITKFDPTVEIHLNVVDSNLRGKVNFPHPTGPKKEKRYLLFSASSAPSKPSMPSVIWGDEKTIDDIETGKLRPNRDFDVVIAQPKFMPQLAKVAKILGPAGMMPNPKNKTVTENVTSALEGPSEASFEYKTDPTAPIVHTTLGKLSYRAEKLTQNLKALIVAIGPSKIKKAVLCSTMSPPVKLDLSTIN